MINANALKLHNLALGLNIRELRASVLGWGSYMFAVTFYCILHHKYVVADPIDIHASIVWVFREWGPWLLVTPWVFKTLRDQLVSSKLHFRFYAALASATLLLTLGYRVGINVFIEGQELYSSIVYFAPRHIAAFAFVVLAWHLKLKPKPRLESPVISPPLPRPAPTLLVSKGHDECLIPMSDIRSISAAGNYVEIFCDNDQYLLRSTLKKIEEELPRGQFVKAHRSHIVNISAIERIKTQSAGNGQIILQCGRKLPLSKRYKQELKALKIHA